MKNLRISLAGAMGLIAVSGAYAATSVKPFEHYQVILDRQPFGAQTTVDSSATSSRATDPAAVAAAASLKLTGLLQGLDGMIRAGFIDLQTKRSYFLAPEEAAGGVRLLAVRYDTQEADLEVSGQKVTLKLPVPTNATAGAAAAQPAAPQNPWEAMMGRMRGDRGGRDDPRNMSSDERRAWFQRMQEQRGRGDSGGGGPGGGGAPTAPAATPATSASVSPEAQAVPAPPAPPEPPGFSHRHERLSGEALENRLQEYQKELIKSGRTPLPIPLTPETDAQLVKEGVLPPQP